MMSGIHQSSAYKAGLQYARRCLAQDINPESYFSEISNAWCDAHSESNAEGEFGQGMTAGCQKYLNPAANERAIESGIDAYPNDMGGMLEKEIQAGYYPDIDATPAFRDAGCKWIIAPQFVNIGAMALGDYAPTRIDEALDALKIHYRRDLDRRDPQDSAKLRAAFEEGVANGKQLLAAAGLTGPRAADGPAFISVTEAAYQTGYTPATLATGRAYIKAEIVAGRLPAQKVGSSYIIAVADFREWLANPKRGSRSK